MGRRPHRPSPPRRSPVPRWLVALLAADVLVALAVGALLLWRPTAEPAAEVPTEAAQVSEPSEPAPTTAPEPVTTPSVAPAVGTTAPACGMGSPSGTMTAVPACATGGVPVASTTPSVAAASAGSPPPGAQRLPPNPLISRGKPALASGDVATPAAVVDGHYCTRPAWRTSTFPSWLAIQVGAGLSRLLLSWNSGDADDYVSFDEAPVAGIPASYTIQTSADSTNGADGTWQTVATVRGNIARTRAHSFPFAGASWVRMTVTGVMPGTEGEPLAIDEIDLHDLSLGNADTVFFMGDSITSASFLRCDRLQPSFAALVNGAYPDYFPALLDGGVSGVSTDYALEQIDGWLEANPDYLLWAMAYGTNDAYREVPSPVFEQRMQMLVDKARAAGREPVLARIPHTLDPDKDEHVQRLNGVIDRLTARNGLRPGPDLYTWFAEHPEELARDGIHPTVAGSLSINRLWFEALRARYQ